MQRVRALSSKVNNNRQMAIAITLRGFSDLGNSMTPVFLSTAHFRYRLFYVLRKNEENLSSGSLNFLQNALRLAVRQFHMPL